MIYKNYSDLSFVLSTWKLIYTSEKIILLHKKVVLASSMYKLCCFSWLQRFCTCASLKHIEKVKIPQRIIFSIAMLVNHTLPTRETTNYHGSESGRLRQLVPLNTWHSMSVSGKKERKNFPSGNVVEMLEFFPEEEEIQIHNSTSFACFSRLYFQPWKLAHNDSCQYMTYTNWGWN